MSLKFFSPIRKTLGLRLSGYFVLFTLGGLGLFAATYGLLSYTLYHRDREAIHSALTEYAEAYHRDGIDAIKEKVAESGRGGALAFFVRVSDVRDAFLYLPPQWDEEFDLERLTSAGADAASWLNIRSKDSEDKEVLEITSLRLADGALLQVGLNSEGRLDLLEVFRSTFAAVMILVVVMGLAAGAFLARRALRPLRDLLSLLRSIVSTGELNARAPVTGTGDELDELGKLFNITLDKIKLLITGMRHALDNVAHDLRTPMTRLRGMAEVALRNDVPAEQLREALVNCIEESDHILAMLNTLMDISEAETGTLKLDIKPVNVGKLIEHVVELYGPVAEEKEIIIITAVPQELTLSADRNRILQVLANLLDNAIKYTSRGGRVDITAALRAQQVVVTVTDTGIGIPSDDLAKIWERLYRGDKSRSQRGLGLGLSLVKAVVHAHQGSVDVVSDSAHGSRFTVTLPA